MDLADAMKNSAVKGIHPEMVSPFPGNGYVSEKLYMLLQLYLQNKSWNPSVELLQCFSELMESSMLPSAAYLQMIAARVTLDNQGRLVLRENGKIILPYEHFANAVMLKHMNGPHGLHLGLEGTVRAVMESYTIGRECFGMEKDFIVEVVQNCPNPACRYYKTQVDMSQKPVHLSAPTYIMESGGPRSNPQVSTPTSQHGGSPQYSDGHPSQSSYIPHSHHSHIPTHSLPPPHMHHSRAQVDLGGSSVEPRNSKPTDLGRSGSMAMPHGGKTSRSPLGPPSAPVSSAPINTQGEANQASHSMMGSDPSAPGLQYKLTDFLRANLDSLEGLPGAKDLLALQNGIWPPTEGNDKKTSSEGQEKIVRTFAEIMMNMARIKSCVRPAMCKPYGKQSEALQKIRSWNISLNKAVRELQIPKILQQLYYRQAKQNRYTGCRLLNPGVEHQNFLVHERIKTLLKNALVDTIQLVQSLRSILPPPHIAVTSWKDEEHKHRYKKCV